MLKKIERKSPCSQSISFRLNPVISNKTVISEFYYNPKLEEKLASIQPKSQVDLSYWYLVDHDMSIIVKQVITNKQCTELWLYGNKITSQGASTLALSLSNNSTLKRLDLSFNHISDAGVRSISRILSPNHNSSLKKLLLNKNGISNDGVQHLAEMLKTNQTLSDLWLANNEISNQGVKQLANVLTYHNKTLKLLSLEYNIFITDECIDYLLEMFEENQTLKTFSINNCNLSEAGKTKLQEKTDKKKKFQIDV